MNPILTDVMPYHPAVFAMGEVYQILIPLAQEAILRVEVGEKCFYDDMCGVLRSSDLIHRVEIPMSILDEAKEYTVVYQRIIDRKAYFPEMEEAVRLCRGRAETECSGNVTRENVERLIGLGVDYVSSGALTHSAPILDLSLKNLHAV